MITQSALIDKFIMGGTSGRASNMEIKGEDLVTTGYGSDVIIAKRMSPAIRYLRGVGYREQKRFILNHELSIDYWLAKEHLDTVRYTMSSHDEIDYCKAPACDLNLVSEFTLHHIIEYTHKMMKAVTKTLNHTRAIVDLHDNIAKCWRHFGNELRDAKQKYIGARAGTEQKDVIKSYMKDGSDLVKAKRQASTYKRQAKKAENRVKELEDELGMRKKDKKMHSVVNTVRKLKAG